VAAVAIAATAALDFVAASLRAARKFSREVDASVGNVAIPIAKCTDLTAGAIERLSGPASSPGPHGQDLQDAP